MAYYFHWPKSEIMKMTGKERLSWLKQIKRIHENQDKKRELELSEQFSILKENNQLIF